MAFRGNGIHGYFHVPHSDADYDIFLPKGGLWHTKQPCLFGSVTTLSASYQNVPAY